MLCFETDKVHVYEFDWGDDECCLYTTHRDDKRVTDEFISQQREMGLPYSHFIMTYEGHHVDTCGLWIDNGQVKINNVCF